MRLHGLAEQVYQILRRRTPAQDPRMSYQAVVDELGSLPPPNEGLPAHDSRLFAALREIGNACHQHNPRLPALSSIVVQNIGDGILGMPGPGYYRATHPDAQSDIATLQAWMREFMQASNTAYPTEL
jgi:hypothetical protein